MKYKQMISRAFLTTGLLLGLFATGMGAKANSIQSDQTNENNNNYNNHTNYTNQNQIQNYNSRLVSNNQQNNNYGPVNNQANNSINSSSLRSFQPHFSNQQSYDSNQSKNEYVNNQYVNNHIRHISRQRINRRATQLSNQIVRNGIYRNNLQTRRNRPVRRLKVYRGQARVRLLRRHHYYHYIRLGNLKGNRIHHYNVRHVNHVKGSHARHQINHTNNSRFTHQSVRHQGMFHKKWFRDGLSRQNYRARKWVSWHESNHRWHVLSYGGVCVGYFQLNPNYLGYRHGHVDLRKRHQVKVADRYVASRYGNWINAKAFWEVHHWY